MSEQPEPIAERIKTKAFWEEPSTHKALIGLVGAIGIVICAVQGNFQAVGVITGGMAGMIAMINFQKVG